MKYMQIILIIFFSLLLSHTVIASSYSNDFSWSTGTEIRLITRLDTTTLDIGWYDVDLIITLLEKNPEAYAIFCIQVDYRISDCYTGYYTFKSTAGIDEPGYSQVARIDFLYSTDWGNVDFEMKFSFKEVFDSKPSKQLNTDWTVFFTIIANIEEEPTSTIPTVTVTVSESSFPYIILLTTIISSMCVITINKRKKQKKLM